MSQKKKVIPNWLETYVVTRINGDTLTPDPMVVGVYASRGHALDACVDYIMEQLDSNENLAYCMCHDYNHRDALQFFAEVPEGRTEVIPERREELKDYLRDELGGTGCYIVVRGNEVQRYSETFRFDVDETGMEDDVTLHTVVTVATGTDDNTPTPESFFSEKAMYEHIRQEIRGYWKDTHKEPIDRKFLNGVIAALRDFGTAQVPIGGDLELHYAVWTQHLGGAYAQMPMQNVD